MTYRVHSYPNGTSTLVHGDSGEVMHSSIGPREEAMLLYVSQSGLANRLSAPGESAPLVLWDVGLGIGANALAAIDCAEQLAGATRKLELHSFENDLAGISHALNATESFPFLHGRVHEIDTLLSRRTWSSERVSWHLHEGDFFEKSRHLFSPEIIFYDFYAPDSCTDLWGAEAFRKLFELTAPRRTTGLPTTVYTYTAATRIRTAMLLAGFHVGYGRATPMKNDTSVASTALGELERPLDARWLERFDRSTSPLPHDWLREAEAGRDPREIARAKLHACPQFVSTG
jgi:queuine tRNA-ribosyltransferase